MSDVMVDVDAYVDIHFQLHKLLALALVLEKFAIKRSSFSSWTDCKNFWGVKKKEKWFLIIVAFWTWCEWHFDNTVITLLSPWDLFLVYNVLDEQWRLIVEYHDWCFRRWWVGSGEKLWQYSQVIRPEGVIAGFKSSELKWWWWWWWW